MTTGRSAALAIAGACLWASLAGGPALAATCNLTVQGAHVIDDEACTVKTGRGVTQVLVGTGGEIRIGRSVMSARLADLRPPRRRGRGAATPLGSVVASDASDGRTCYFGQKAVLCVEP